jgi:peptidoglycan/LPS O-acetylase OafA/YrhL
LAWFVALLLLQWGNASYPKLDSATAAWKMKILHAIAWASPRSYCAFLIHFAFILLANTLYIASGLHSYGSGLIAIGLMVGVLVCSSIAAQYIYRWVEQPSGRLKL